MEPGGERMPVIYLEKHRKLTEEKKKLALLALQNEINDVEASLEMMEEELQRTMVFSKLDLVGFLREYVAKLPRNRDGSYSEEFLKKVYESYFGE